MGDRKHVDRVRLEIAARIEQEIASNDEIQREAAAFGRQVARRTSRAARPG